MVGEPLRCPALQAMAAITPLSQPLKFVRTLAILQTENVGHDFVDLKVGEQPVRHLASATDIAMKRAEEFP